MTIHCSQTLAKLVIALNTLDQWITDIPPVAQQGRFGNLAFRSWHERLVQVQSHTDITAVPS